MANQFHKSLVGDDNHVVHAYTYANAAARTGATGFVSGDIGKIALQSDNGSFWILQTIAPVWVELGVGDDSITNTKLANMPTQTIKGRTTAGTGDPEDLTATQATAILNNFVGDSGAGGIKGLVPAPAIGDAVRFLKGDGTWSVPAGAGDVSGPASSVDSEIVLFDGITGKVLKRATGTGVVKATSGVFSVSNVNLGSEVTGTLPIANGGTGNTTANAAFGALSPMTTDGDLITRAGGVPTRLGIGSSGQFLSVSGGAPVWAASPVVDPFSAIDLIDHFVTPSATTERIGLLNWGNSATGTGNSTTALAGETRRTGIIQLNAGTTAGGRNGLYLGTSGAGHTLLMNGTGMSVNWKSRMRLTGTLTTFEMMIAGLGDVQTAVGDQTNGIYFQLLGDTTPDTNWFLVAANGGTRTRLNTGIAYSSTAWHDFEFSYTVGSGTITGYIDGASIGTISTNIPTVACSPTYKVDSIAGGSNVFLDIDIFRMQVSGMTF